MARKSLPVNYGGSDNKTKMLAEAINNTVEDIHDTYNKSEIDSQVTNIYGRINDVYDSLSISDTQEDPYIYGSSDHIDRQNRRDGDLYSTYLNYYRINGDSVISNRLNRNIRSGDLVYSTYDAQTYPFDYDDGTICWARYDDNIKRSSGDPDYVRDETYYREYDYSYYIKMLAFSTYKVSSIEQKQYAYAAYPVTINAPGGSFINFSVSIGFASNVGHKNVNYDDSNRNPGTVVALTDNIEKFINAYEDYKLTTISQDYSGHEIRNYGSYDEERRIYLLNEDTQYSSQYGTLYYISYNNFFHMRCTVPGSKVLYVIFLTETYQGWASENRDVYTILQGIHIKFNLTSDLKYPNYYLRRMYINMLNDTWVDTYNKPTSIKYGIDYPLNEYGQDGELYILCNKKKVNITLSDGGRCKYNNGVYTDTDYTWRTYIDEVGNDYICFTGHNTSSNTAKDYWREEDPTYNDTIFNDICYNDINVNGLKKGKRYEISFRFTTITYDDIITKTGYNIPFNLFGCFVGKHEKISTYTFDNVEYAYQIEDMSKVNFYFYDFVHASADSPYTKASISFYAESSSVVLRFYLMGFKVSNTDRDLSIRDVNCVELVPQTLYSKIDGIWTSLVENTDRSSGYSLIPKMTSDTTPKGSVSYSSQKSSEKYAAYQAFSQEPHPVEESQIKGWITRSDDGTPYIQYTFDNVVSLSELYIETYNFHSYSWTTSESRKSRERNITVNRSISVQGLTSDNIWENCLASGLSYSLTFSVGEYNEYSILLNNNPYKAIRISGNESWYYPCEDPYESTQKYYECCITHIQAFSIDDAEYTKVVANPEGEASTDLNKLQVGELIYNIPDTEVIANPQGETIADLKSIQIGNNIYGISGEKVSYEPSITSGVLLGNIKVGNQLFPIYAPEGSIITEDENMIVEFTDLSRTNYDSKNVYVEFVSYTLISDPNA